MALYDKELADIKAANDRFFRRSTYLFSADGTPKYPEDEHVRRSEEFVEQFDRTARRLVKKAERDAEKQNSALANSTNEREAEKARLRLEAAHKLKEGVLKIRANVVNEEGEEGRPRSTRPLFPE